MTDNNINSVLFELQRNLEDLSSARTQMDEFRTSSSKVVRGIDDVQSKYVIHLENIKTDYEKRVNELKVELTSFTSKNYDDNKTTIQKIVLASEESIRNGVRIFETVSNNVEKSNNDNVKAIKNLLERYSNVVEASNSLIETLTAIDFPTKLDALSSKSQLIIESITSAKQALEIKSNETQNAILDKTAISKELIIKDNEIKFNSLIEKVNETKSSLKETFENSLTEQSKIIKSGNEDLYNVINTTFDKTNQRLEKQDKEIKTLKILLFAITGLAVIGIAVMVKSLNLF